MVVTLALAAAVCFALASVLQHHAASTAPIQRRLRVGLVTHLIRRPGWLAGVAFDGAGYGFQVWALDHGPLSLVQPLLAGGLLFALLFNNSPGERGLHRRDWLAAALTAGGLAVFVVVGSPRGQETASLVRISPLKWVVFAAVTGGLVAAAVGLSARRGPAGRAALLAAGAGIAFGLCAGLTKQALAELHHGLGHVLTTGYVYALVGAGIGGTVLAQSAFQAGALAASLPTLTLSEPVFAVAAGVVLFDEHVRRGLPGMVAVLGAAASAVGVVLLARSPRAQPVIAP